MKSYTDLKQSQKLTEILPIETADNHYVRKVIDFVVLIRRLRYETAR